MDFGSDSDVFEQTQHRANELFCFEPKDDQVEAIQHLLCDRNRILIVEIGFIIFQAAPRSIIHEESKHASLIIMPLNLLEEGQAEKLKRMAAWQEIHAGSIIVAVKPIELSITILLALIFSSDRAERSKDQLPKNKTPEPKDDSAENQFKELIQLLTVRELQAMRRDQQSQPHFFPLTPSHSSPIRSETDHRESRS
ncbi:hypothetical protein V8E54_002481 [Elaphomyces granulatus]